MTKKQLKFRLALELEHSKKLHKILNCKNESIEAYKQNLCTRDNVIGSSQKQIGLLEYEVENYRDLFMNSEEDFQNLKIKYENLKRTVIKKFKENKSLKAKIKSLQEGHKIDKMLRFGAMYGRTWIYKHDENMDEI